MVAWIGKWLFAVGVIHSLFGLLFMRVTLAVLWSEGLLNTVNGQPRREAVFWFLCTGLLLLIVAALVDQAERQRNDGRSVLTEPELGTDRLERDFALQGVVEADVNRAHATLSEHIDNSDVADILAEEGGCLRFHGVTRISGGICETMMLMILDYLTIET